MLIWPIRTIIWRNFYINLLVSLLHKYGKLPPKFVNSKFTIKKLVAISCINNNYLIGVIKMFRKKPSEEKEYDDFFSRFSFDNDTDLMTEFEDK